MLDQLWQLGSIRFEWWWAFALLPLPLLTRRLFPRVATRQAALKVPSLTPYRELDSDFALSSEDSRWLLLLATLAWLCLISALARPIWYGEPIAIDVSGRDLMLAVDLSGSMQTEDFVIGGNPINRLQATQQLAGEFIQRRHGDRLGLILFGRQAYLQSPLTFDRQTVSTFLHEATIGLAGKETAIGDAIGLAVKRLQDHPQNSRILILLTDGANTAGAVDPLTAAQLAAQQGLKIYTIGIGADEMTIRSFFGSRRVNPSADLDETMLTQIATTTGGRYFRARDSEQLNGIYQLLDQLEPITQEAQTFRPQKSLFYLPLTAALLLATLILGWRYRP